MKNFDQKLFSINKPLAYLGLFLLVFSVRLITLNNYGSSTPYFDDWDMGVFIHRYADQSLNLIDWFTPAYEHQMMFSKFFNILFFSINGLQWDTLNILIFNSILWSAIAILLAFVARTHRDQINAPVFIFFMSLLWLLPISIQISTFAIATHYYFMMIFLLLAYSGVGYKPYSSRWIVSIISLTCCSFTIGAGVFASLPLLLIFGYRIIVEPNNKKDNIHTFVTLCLVGLIAVSSTFLWGLAASSNDIFLVKSTNSFFSTLMKTLSWPLLEHHSLGIVLVCPTIILVIAVVKKSVQFTPIVIFTLALSAYMTMQAFGIAYARNSATGINPALRYYEFLLLSLIVNFIALLIIQNKGQTLVPPALNRLILILWFSVLYISIPGQINMFEYAAEVKLERRSSQTILARDYLRTGDINRLMGHPYFDIAYPQSYHKLASWLDHYNKLTSLPMELQVPERLSLSDADSFVYNATIKPNTGGYNQKYYNEDVIGSYNLKKGAQNAKGDYTSQIYQNSGSYIMIPTLGFLGLDDLSLEVVEIETGEVHKVEPNYNSSTPEVWQANYVPLPVGEYRIEAHDDSKNLWFGFAAPRVVGRLSYFVRVHLIAKRELISYLGLFLLLFALQKPLSRVLQRTQALT